MDRRGAEKRWTKLIAWTLCLEMALGPMIYAVDEYSVLSRFFGGVAVAADMEAAAEGQTFGTQILDTYNLPTFQQQGADVTTGTEVHLPTLYPGMTGDPVTGNADLSSAYAPNANTTLSGMTSTTQTNLLDPGNISPEAQAYQTIWAAEHSRSHPDMTNDPIWSRTDQVLTGEDPIWDEAFSGCTAVDAYTANSASATIHDYRTCQRAEQRPPSCSVERQVQVVDFGFDCSVPRDVSFSSSRMSATLRVWCDASNIYVQPRGIGGWACFDYNCAATYPTARLTKTATAQVVTPSTIIWENMRANNCAWGDENCTQEYAYPYQVQADPTTYSYPWNIYFTPGSFANYGLLPNPLYVSPANPENLIYHSYYRRSLYLYLNGGGCNSTTGECTLSFSYYDLYWGDDNAYQGLRQNRSIDIAQGPTVDDTITYQPPGCLASAVDDSYCDGQWVCTTQDNARVVSGVTVTPSRYGSSLTSMYPGDNPSQNICYEAEYRYDCTGGFSGAMDCYTDINGVEHCPTNTASGTMNTCTALEDAGCAFVRSACTEGALDPVSGYCALFTDVYDCGQTVPIASIDVTRDINCTGPIDCMGTECTTPVWETNTGFTRAAAYLEMLNFIHAENPDCALDASGELNCTIFVGESYWCKEAVFGIVDCCSQPSGVSASDYIALAMASWEAAEKLGIMDSLAASGLDVAGAWDTMTQPLTATWDTITKPFTSAYESLATSVTGEVAQQAWATPFQSLAYNLANEVGGFIAQTFGDDVATFLLESNGTNAAGQPLFTGALGPGMQFIMTAYMIYSVAMILIQIIWACEEREYELGVKRALKSCHYVGTYCADEILGSCIETRHSYCCYQSPLARIMQEQLRPLLGMTFGTGESPDCSGLGLQQFANADWSQVDLSEWVALLTQANVLPSNTQDAIERYSEEGLSFDNYANTARPTSSDRVTERMDLADPEASRQQTRDQLWGSVP